MFLDCFHSTGTNCTSTDCTGPQGSLQILRLPSLELGQNALVHTVLAPRVLVRFIDCFHGTGTICTSTYCTGPCFPYFRYQSLDYARRITTYPAGMTANSIG